MQEFHEANRDGSMPRVGLQFDSRALIHGPGLDDSSSPMRLGYGKACNLLLPPYIEVKYMLKYMLREGKSHLCFHL